MRRYKLFHELKQEAARSRMILRQVIKDYLRKGMETARSPKKYIFRWKASPRGKMMPGVRINERKSLYDLMDGIE
jgi:hypothetical protein